MVLYLPFIGVDLFLLISLYAQYQWHHGGKTHVLLSCLDEFNSIQAEILNYSAIINPSYSYCQAQNLCKLYPYINNCGYLHFKKIKAEYCIAQFMQDAINKEQLDESYCRRKSTQE